MNMIVIEDYYQVITMYRIIIWMNLTCLLSIFYINLKPPLCTSTFTSKKLIAFLIVHIGEEEKLSLLLVCAWYKESNPFYMLASNKILKLEMYI